MTFTGSKSVAATVYCFALMAACGRTLGAASAAGDVPPILQPLAAAPGPAPLTLHTGAAYYIPATLATIRWGYLPDAQSAPILTIPSGAVVTFDTLSHEGLLEDQGRDPLKFFAEFGVPPADVLNDGAAIAKSALAHDFSQDGPHIVIGPVAVAGAEPGDLLKIEYLSFVPRVPYGVISNRHGKGALPGEFPESSPPGADADAAHPAEYHNESQFVRLLTLHGKLVCSLPTGEGGTIEFAAAPFLGTVGVAPDSAERTNSIPPGSYGGNLDIRNLTAGAILYLPVQVTGAKLFVADPHFAQGGGEVALTAVEGSLRATMRITVLKRGTPAYPFAEPLREPFAETPEFWIPIGLDPDLNEAMKKAVRSAVDYLSSNQHLTRAAALAYLSAATNFEVSQVVDRTKGIHGLIRKSDFAAARRKSRRQVPSAGAR
jgi:acetamidase/formamidase